MVRVGHDNRKARLVAPISMMMDQGSPVSKSSRTSTSTAELGTMR